MATKKLKLDWALDLESTLSSRVRNRIKAIGVELEGGWEKQPTLYKVVRDGSVKNIKGFASIGDRTPLLGEGIAGELVSPPLSMAKGFGDKAEPFMRKFYPKAINETCGMHVHMSFVHVLNYMQSMRSEYPATVVVQMRKWAEKNNLPMTHPIWPRLEGQSEYCQFVYHPEAQILNDGKDFDKHREGHRYSVINWNFSRTGTIECRLLPMMETTDLAISAIRHLLGVTNAFLVATAKKEKKLTVSVNDDTRSREVREIYV